MYKIIIMLSTITFFAITGFAQHTKQETSVKKTAPQEMTFMGDIIDNHCAQANKDSLSSFVPKHTKECVLSPDCEKSGFSLYTTGGNLLAFDKASDAKIKKFLMEPQSRLQVTVVVKEEGKMLHLVSIKNRV